MLPFPVEMTMTAVVAVAKAAVAKAAAAKAAAAKAVKPLKKKKLLKKKRVQTQLTDADTQPKVICLESIKKMESSKLGHPNHSLDAQQLLVKRC